MSNTTIQNLTGFIDTKKSQKVFTLWDFTIILLYEIKKKILFLHYQMSLLPHFPVLFP